MSQTHCSECGMNVKNLDKCPGCWTDLRAKCNPCDLPLSGEGPLCRCGGFEFEEEKRAFFANSPKTKGANKPDGGRGHGHLRLRRAQSGY